jgi:hypothetical protein
MDLRDRRGGFSPAEGCLFLAVILFVGILVAVGIIAFFRFQEPPGNLPPRPSPSTQAISYQLSAISQQTSGPASELMAAAGTDCRS